MVTGLLDMLCHPPFFPTYFCLLKISQASRDTLHLELATTVRSLWANQTIRPFWSPIASLSKAWRFLTSSHQLVVDSL